MQMQCDWLLPAGYLDADGCLHRQVELDPLTGREEELLTGNAYPTAALVTGVLSRCVKRIGSINEITPELVRELLVGDRQYLLLILRQLTFGDRVQASLPCPWPGCGKGVDIEFLISQIPITGSERRAVYDMEVEPFIGAGSLGLSETAKSKVIYRLPNGGDQEAVLVNHPRTTEVEALSLILSRCIHRFGDIEQPAPDWVAQLPAALRQQIEQDMEQRAPNLELSMEAVCPACQREFLAPFELQDFFFGELKTGVELLFREVHYLAFHYHWSEQEIMSMPRHRRRRYIEVLADEIEQLNDHIE